MRLTVSGVTRLLPRSARETVGCETPATCATSLIVTGMSNPDYGETISVYTCVLPINTCAFYTNQLPLSITFWNFFIDDDVGAMHSQATFFGAECFAPRFAILILLAKSVSNRLGDCVTPFAMTNVGNHQTFDSYRLVCY